MIFVEDPTIDPAVLLFVTETPYLEYVGLVNLHIYVHTHVYITLL